MKNHLLFLSDSTVKNRLRKDFFRGYIKVALLSVPAFMLSISACNKTAENPQAPDSQTTECHKTPSSIAYGSDTFDFVYNLQAQPVRITNSRLVDPGQGGPAAPTVVYFLEYNGQGQLIKMSRTKDSKAIRYSVFEYNGGGKVIKEMVYDAQNLLLENTTAEYNGESLSKLITRYPNGAPESSVSFRYTDGDLSNKTVRNIYDPSAKEYFDAEFSYEYYVGNARTEQSFFSGIVGARFISGFTDSPSLYYIPDAAKPQLLFSSESSVGTHRLKSIKVQAHHLISDETSINFDYRYDNAGSVTTERISADRKLVQSKPTPFGVDAIVTTPINTSSTTTIHYTCK